MPVEHRVNANGLDIAVFEYGTSGQPILFAHATSFHARVWDQVIALLPEFHCFAVDLRGHGRSGKPKPPHYWRYVADDLVEVGKAFGLQNQNTLGVGHSIGGHAVAEAAGLQPDLFASLLLIDPVIMPRENYVGVTDFGHFAAKRRNEWASKDEMYERFKDRPPFNAWKPQILRDYVEYGLVPNPNGSGFVLACTPDYEAESYNYAPAANIYNLITTIPIPTTILRAGGISDASVFNLSASPTAPDLAAQFAQGKDVSLPQLSHFIPMEAPELTADYVRKAASGVWW
ncbi:MAG TPA: alpha/beta hydrolase [Phototrophicaceae bacterium]|nr:alpha/beta hydrolase [Phototrophicaceae bacterium]